MGRNDSCPFLCFNANYPMQMNQTLQHAEIRSTLQCPTCSTSRLYQLADGRFKCSLCRKIFSATANRQNRLAPVVREGLATAFWNMDGTADTAIALDLNIKTVQKYFGLLREHLARLSRQSILQQLESDTLPASWLQRFPQQQSCGQTASPIAAIVKSGDAINFLFAAPVASQPRFQETAILGWLLAQDDESLQKLNLDKMHCQSRDSDSITLTTPFWRFIKQGLIHYQGGFRHHFFQYLREMEFRYNDRQKQRGPDICLHFLAFE